MATKRTSATATAREQYQTEGARAFADMAAAQKSPAERRGFYKLAFEADKAAREALISELETLKDDLMRKLERANKMRTLTAVGSE
jgi:hypothetical protein